MPITKTEVVVDPEVTEQEASDPRYFELLEPITVGKDTIFSKILIDSTELRGPTYFKLVERFRKEHPQRYREATSGAMPKVSDDIFMTYVIAELNPPMTVEDVQYKLSFNDLEILLVRAKNFVFLKRAQKENPAT